MGYRIVYGRNKRRFRQLKKRGKTLMLSIVVCVVLIIAGYFGGAKLLLPGDPDVSATALENMVDSVQGGEKISDAIVAFCREIIANAEIPQ